MKAKVIKRFKDKYTNKIHEVSKDGEFIEVTEERFNEILQAGNYIEAITDDVSEGKNMTDGNGTAENKTSKDDEKPAEDKAASKPSKKDNTKKSTKENDK